ncbi:MAG TPA: hypothetical protein VF665_12965 [Longimicrobium sp.]|jgi:hypothetical protein|uniref:hypothetical protein n=1 Tax=Longimicrobium sp. TaxID=2029185 RepID=UPI002EDA1770
MKVIPQAYFRPIEHRVQAAGKLGVKEVPADDRVPVVCRSIGVRQQARHGNGVPNGCV